MTKNKKESLFVAIPSFIVLGLPLLYVATDNGVVRGFRLLVILALGLGLGLFAMFRQHALTFWKRLDRGPKIALSVLIASIGISTALSSMNSDALFGLSPAYLGVASWLCFIAVAIFLSSKFNTILLSWVGFGVATLVSIISLLTSTFYIQYGFRVSGLLLQETALGCYAGIGAIIALYLLRNNLKPQFRYLLVAGFAINITTLILTQSRAFYAATIIACAVWAYYTYRQSRASAIVSLIGILVLTLAPIVGGSYFARFESSSMQNGIQYRADMYRVAARDIARENYLIGNGANSLPPDLNNENTVPADIAKTLKEGNVFMSAHDLFFDTAYYFGIPAAISLIYLFGMAAYKLMRQRQLALVLILGLLLVNALINVPSLELTLLSFVVAFGALSYKHAR